MRLQFLILCLFLINQAGIAQITFPEPSQLASDQYITIEPGVDFQCYNCETCSEYVRPRDADNMPGNQFDTRPDCGTLSWRQLITNKVSGKNVEYVFLKPGDYRCLGIFFVNGSIDPNEYQNGDPKETTILYYNDQATGDDRFLPENNSPEDQVIISGLYLYAESNQWIFHGLTIDAIGNPVAGFNPTLGSQFYKSHDNKIYNCIFQNINSTGIRIRGDRNVVENCVFRNQKDPFSDGPAIYISTLEPNDLSFEDNVIRDNIIFNFSDGIQVGKSPGTDARGTIISGNTIFVDEFLADNELGFCRRRSIYENAIDLKLGGVLGNEMIVENNTIYGYRPAINDDNDFNNLRSLGQGITLHDNIGYVKVINNTIFDCSVGLSLSLSNDTMVTSYDDYEGILIQNNAFCNIRNDAMYPFAAANDPNYSSDANNYLKVGSGIFTDLSRADLVGGLKILDNTFFNLDRPIHVISFSVPTGTQPYEIENNSHNNLTMIETETPLTTAQSNYITDDIDPDNSFSFCHTPVSTFSGVIPQYESYIYQPTDSTNCGSSALQIEGDKITQSPRANRIRVIPNPAKDQFLLKLDSEFILPGKVDVYTMTGERILQTELNNFENMIKMTDVAKGMYIITIIDATGQFHQLKIILQ